MQFQATKHNTSCKYNTVLLWFNARNVLKQYMNCAVLTIGWPPKHKQRSLQRSITLDSCTKLKTGLPETTPKKPRIAKKFYSDRSTTLTPGRLWIQDFLNPPVSDSKRSEPICYGACGVHERNLRRYMVACHVQV